MAKERQRALPGFELEAPALYVPPPAAGPVANPCAFCGGPGDYLCDYMLGQSKGGIFTCDAPMCRHCKKEMMRGFACSRGRGGHGCEIWTTDYCPKHAVMVGLSPRTVITAEEAERIRATLWKKS